jgi:hypothetical protein
VPDSSARRPQPGSPIFTTLTHGFDAGTAQPTPAQGRGGATATGQGPVHGSADCPIFDQLAGRRLARRRSNVVHPA